jgi:hypothetical protein
MKTLSLLLLASVASAAPEAARLSGEAGLVGAAAHARTFLEVPGFEQPILQDPKLAPAPDFQIQGGEIGRASLPGLLDKHRDLLVKQLGAANWLISAASDAEVKNYYFRFEREQTKVYGAIGDLNRLRGEGVNITIQPGLTYNFKVSPNIFDPVRGSTLKISPVNGTQGPKHDVKTGAVLDSLKSKSYVFKAGDKELWMVHGTDVDPKTSQAAETKSLLFIHLNGLSSKAWPVAEKALEAEKAYNVDFEGTQLTLVKHADGQLSIHSR